ncbi:TPA: ubiquitin-activating enzyme E1 family protein [Neisseria meningitidis]
MPSEAQFGVQTALRLKSKKLKATGIYPEKQKTQEFIGKNNNLSTVIPTKVGILIRPHGNLYFVITETYISSFAPDIIQYFILQ